MLLGAYKTLMYLNTSYVKVLPIPALISAGSSHDLNTSYVKVLLKRKACRRLGEEKI